MPDLNKFLGIPFFPQRLSGKDSTCNAGDLSAIPGWGRSPGEGIGNPLHYFTRKIPWTEKPGRLQSVGSQRDTTEQIHTRPEFLDSEGSLLRAWGLIPGRGTKIPQATQRSQKINRQIPVSYTEIVLICIFIFGIIKLIIKT